MLKLAAQRLVALVPLLFIVSLLTFSITDLLPGNPAELIVGDDATQEQVDLVHERLGLDQPWPQRYWDWLTNAVQGDLGTSFFNSVEVTDAVLLRLPVTLSLTLAAVVVALIIGIGAGLIAALRPGGWTDRAATAGATVGQALPNFWLALILAVVFAVKIRWFPATGYTPLTESPGAWLRSITLPAVALGVGAAAILARQTRSAMVGVLQTDYVRAARAQGLSARRVVLKHALKNAMLPVVTVLAFQVTVLLGGAIIVEQVFAVNGLGSLAVTAVRRQDVPLVQGVVIVSVIVVVLVQLATDLLYGYLNPKARPS